MSKKSEIFSKIYIIGDDCGDEFIDFDRQLTTLKIQENAGSDENIWVNHHSDHIW